MSALSAHTPRDDAAELLRQHGGDAEAALLAALAEIDRLGLLLEVATYHSSWGYRWGRLRSPRPVVPAPGGTVKPLDLTD